MGKTEIALAFFFGVIMTLFVINAIGPYEAMMNSPTGAVIYDPSNEVIDVVDEKIDYSLIDEAFQSNDVSTYAAECKPNAYIIDGNVTKYLCSVYYEDRVDVRQVSPTGSMLPNLMSGGFVFAKDVREISELAVGDIVVISDRIGNDIAHRIIEVDYDNLGEYIVTQGDNNSFSDGIRFRISDIEAKVVGILY
jgi:signal peptidase I